MDALGIDRTVVARPFPEAGRTVYNGHLFVEGTLLDETSMRDHPLTPMTDSRILRLLVPQTRRPVAEVHHQAVAAGINRIRDALRQAGEAISVVDAISRPALDAVAEAFRDWPLVSGGAGMAASFDAVGGADIRSKITAAQGFSAVLADSASAENQRQIADAIPTLPSRKLSPSALRGDSNGEIADLTPWAAARWQEDPDRAVLVYSVGEPSDVDLNDQPGGETTAALIERALGACARVFVDRGVNRLIVASGETSGSVTNALGIRTFDVGRPISPGLAWAAASSPPGR